MIDEGVHYLSHVNDPSSPKRLPLVREDTEHLELVLTFVKLSLRSELSHAILETRKPSLDKSLNASGRIKENDEY